MNSEKKIVLLGQGSQMIQLMRELFSLEITPDNIKVITVDGEFNNPFTEYLKYFQIDYYVTNKDNFNTELQGLIFSFNPDLVISLSNPLILSKETLSLQTKFINFHPGILPYYKGSLSTVHSILNNEDFVGGTWHYIDPGIDTGNIIHIVKIRSEKISAFSLNHKIFSLGISNLEKVLEKVYSNDPGISQEKKGRFYYNKFPDVSDLEIETQKRVLYFPPKFT